MKKKRKSVRWVGRDIPRAARHRNRPAIVTRRSPSMRGGDQGRFAMPAAAAKGHAPATEGLPVAPVGHPANPVTARLPGVRKPAVPLDRWGASKEHAPDALLFVWTPMRLAHGFAANWTDGHRISLTFDALHQPAPRRPSDHEGTTVSQITASSSDRFWRWSPVRRAMPLSIKAGSGLLGNQPSAQSTVRWILQRLAEPSSTGGWGCEAGLG